MGVTPPSRGRIRFSGEDIRGTAPYQLARKGMGWVPDDRRIFADLTVGENLEIAARRGPGSEKWDKHRVYELFPGLKNDGSTQRRASERRGSRRCWPSPGR